MHVLLVAYDFPPIPSPQSLRWAYLVREMALAGHRVRVIMPDVPGYGRGGLPELPDSVEIHRVYPGRLSALVQGRRGKTQDTVAASAASVITPVVRGNAVALNWKGRLRVRLESALGLRHGLNWKGQLAEWSKQAVSCWVFPDYRMEWVEHAVAMLDELVAAERPDLVLVSHEPACSLPVGLAAVERGLPLAVDMGDPVLAPYTPRRWRKKAFELERAVCRAACLVSVTTDAAAVLLKERHHLEDGKSLVLRQGYDPRFVASSNERWLDFDDETLELLYTGSFYSFRRAEELLQAVIAMHGVRLTIATISAPDYLQQAAAEHPAHIRLVDFLPHRVALAAQRDCDVLLNIANADPVQVPGKVFEYLGAGKPIVHLRGDQQDATGQLLSQLEAGWEITASAAAIGEVLQLLRQRKRDGQLAQVVMGRGDVESYAWPALAETWVQAADKRLHREAGLQGMEVNA